MFTAWFYPEATNTHGHLACERNDSWKGDVKGCESLTLHSLKMFEWTVTLGLIFCNMIACTLCTLFDPFSCFLGGYRDVYDVTCSSALLTGFRDAVAADGATPRPAQGAWCSVSVIEKRHVAWGPRESQWRDVKRTKRLSYIFIVHYKVLLSSPSLVTIFTFVAVLYHLCHLRHLYIYVYLCIYIYSHTLVNYLADFSLHKSQHLQNQGCFLHTKHGDQVAKKYKLNKSRNPPFFVVENFRSPWISEKFHSPRCYPMVALKTPDAALRGRWRFLGRGVGHVTNGSPGYTPR